MSFSIRNILLFVLMLATAGLAIAIRPVHRFADQGPKVELEKIIPRTFGNWKEEIQGSAHIVDPNQKQTLDMLYTETLSRTYVSEKGERVMLSIAYGEDQSRDLQIHRPEVCYSAQGFEIVATAKRLISTSSGNIPVMQIVAKQGGRDEPITYWVRFGNKIVRGNLEQGVARLGYGISGYIADGVLFRVSTISQTPDSAFEQQTNFIDQLLKSVTSDTKTFLLGGQLSS